MPHVGELLGEFVGGEKTDAGLGIVVRDDEGERLAVVRHAFDVVGHEMGMLL
jgi:hypothetical protein